jgi:hypothetical protein
MEPTTETTEFITDQQVEIRDQSGGTVGHGTITRVSGSTRPRCSVRTINQILRVGCQFSALTGEEIGGTRRLVAVTPERWDELERLHAALVLARQEEEQQRSRAAYDALPEGVKLARTLRYFCDGASDEQLGAMPLDILRAAVE